MKILKGLTKELIKASKNKELNFTKEELKNIEDTAKVQLKKDKDGFYLSLWCKYGESCGGVYLWVGNFSYYKNKDSYMHICSGFTANPIGRIEENYTCKRGFETDYKEEFKTVLKYMIDARKASIRADKAYCDYVVRTGDLS